MIKQKPDKPDGNLAVETLYEDPNTVPWSSQQTFRGVLFTLVPYIAFSLLVTAFSGNNAGMPQPTTLAEDLFGGVIGFLFTLFLEGAFLIAPLHYARRALEETRAVSRAILRALGLRKFQIARAIFMIVCLFILIYLFDQFYGYLIDHFKLNIQTNDQRVLQEGEAQPITTYGLLLGSVICAPICEELFFRGFLMAGLLKDLSPAWAILISSTLFALTHLDPGSFLPLLFIGMALGWLRWQTRSTWPGIILHMLNNGFSATLIILTINHVPLPGFLS